MCTTCGCSDPSHQNDSRLIEVEKNLLAKNDSYAEKNRTRLEESNVLALNLVSSPGSGKTSLLTTTINMLNGELAVCVIEGDQQTDYDTKRIIETGAKAIQINTYSRYNIYRGASLNVFKLCSLSIIMAYF